MPHVRSVTVGVWLTRGSRHESDAAERHRPLRRAHAVQGHRRRRSAEDIAQAIDSIGGQLDAFTAKEYAGYYIKVLDEHLPLAVDLLSRHRHASGVCDGRHRAREEASSSKRSRWSRTRPTTWCTRSSRSSSGKRHPLGRPILGTPGDRRVVHAASRCASYFWRTYVAPNLIVSAAGNLDHARVADARSSGAFGDAADRAPRRLGERRRTSRRGCVRADRRTSSRATSASARPAYQQNHDDRYVLYVLNTMLGGSMSSRLFQNIREKRGLAYAVFSGLSAYRDAGSSRSTPGARPTRCAR